MPDVAIGSEQARKYVLAVNSENVASPKYVTLGQLVGELRVIKSGIDKDDTIIVNGVAHVRPGQKVTPHAEKPAAPAAADAKAPAPAKTD